MEHINSNFTEPDLQKSAILQIKQTIFCKISQTIKDKLSANCTVYCANCEVPAHIHKILDKVGKVESAAVAKYLYNQATLAKDTLLADKLPPISKSQEEINLHIVNLDSEIALLFKKIEDHNKHTESRTDSFLNNIAISGKDILQYYNIDNAILADIKIYKNIIEHLSEFTKQIRTKWFLLLDHIDESALNIDDAKFIYEHFATYSNTLNEKINEERESRTYFTDLFEVLAQGSLKAITDEYKLLWDEFAKHLYSANYDDLHEIIVDLNRNGNLEFLPIKDKFTTSQLEHNYEVLNSDLTKFALADISQMDMGELSDYVNQYQIKIKKSQAISKELQNRRSNQNISIINRLTYIVEDTRLARSVYELYTEFFAFILHNDLIIHKWNLLNLFSMQTAEQAATTNIDSLAQLQAKLNDLTTEKDMYVKLQKYMALDETSRLYGELIDYYTEQEHIVKQKESVAAALHLLKDMLSEISANLESIPVNMDNIIRLLPQAQVQPNHSEILNQIQNNLEQIKQAITMQTNIMDKVIAKRELSNPRFKKISSTGTSDTEDEQYITSAPFNSPERQHAIYSQAPVVEFVAAPVSAPELLLENMLEITNNLESHENDQVKHESVASIEIIPIELESTLQHADNSDSSPAPVSDIKKVDNNSDNLPAPVGDIKEAAEKYNIPEYITRPESNLAYFCMACEKQFKFSSTKPQAHCKTTTHNKKFLHWVNKNKLIIQ